MIKSGVCSVTFREKTPEEVIALAVDAGLDGIEWGADIHVPPGDLDNARRVGELTRDAGLEVAGYGSYLFAFDEADQPPSEFLPTLKAALALGAPVIRIWAGSMVIEKTPAYFDRVVERSRQAAMAAGEAGISIAYEYHPSTFTETLEGAQALLVAVNHPNLHTYWQPPHGSELDQRLGEIAALKDSLLNLHVFHWDYVGKPTFPRLALEEGACLCRNIFNLFY